MLQLHPNGRFLLVHARDGLLRMMDLRILAVKKYLGATNYRERICSTVTPCGTWIFSGSEDGMAYVWNAETGDQVAVYSELGYSSAVHAVAFHPHENMVAFCAFGQGQPVHVYLHDHKVTQLQSLTAASRSASDIRTLRSTPDPPSGMEAATRALKLQSIQQRLDSVLVKAAERFVDVNLDASKAPPLFCLQNTLGQTSPGSSHGPGGATLEHASYTFANRSSLGASGRGLAADDGAVEFSASLAPRLHHARTPPAGRSRGVSPVSQFAPGPCEPIQVVSLFDYRASRSDELSLRRGDVIQVLHKDNQTWWFGRMRGGLKGYFLSAYVVDQRDFSEQNTDALLDEETATRATPTRVSAAVSSSGELRFLSEPTLSDTEPELTDARTRRKKKVKKPGVPVSSSQTTVSDADTSGSTRTIRGRPLPPRPAGRSNRAFEADT